MNKKYLLSIAIFMVAIAGGCTTSGDSSSLSVSKQNPVSPDKSVSYYTMVDVAKHGNKSDCWTAIDGKVYDITPLIEKHPGGEAILKACGDDGTKLFSDPKGDGKGHSSLAQDKLAATYRGELE